MITGGQTSFPVNEFAFAGVPVNSVQALPGALSLSNGFAPFTPSCSSNGFPLFCGQGPETALGFNGSCAVLAAFWSDFQSGGPFGDIQSVGSLDNSQVRFAQLSDRLVVEFQNFSFEDGSSCLAGCGLGGPPMTFQIHLIGCGNRIEYHFVTDIYLPGFVNPVVASAGGQNGVCGVLTQVDFNGEDNVFGVPPANGDLLLSCNMEIAAGTSFAVTRGPLPVNNGVTNKLDAFTFELLFMSGTEAAVGDNDEPIRIYEYLGTADFDEAGLGPIASTFMKMTLATGCGFGSVFSLAPQVGFPESFVSLSFNGSPNFGTQPIVTLNSSSFSTEYEAAILVASPPTLGYQSPFSMQELWVDLVSPSFVLIQPLEEEGGGLVESAVSGDQFFGGTANFFLTMPEFTPSLCGQRFHMQGAALAPGATPNLTRGFVAQMGVSVNQD